jgi:hypothetical protein
MRIFHAFNTTRIVFSIEFEKMDRMASADMDGFENTSFRIMLPDTIRAFEDLHPDSWAIIVVLALHPYITHSLTLSFPVSQHLAHALPFNIYPIDFRLYPKPRHIGRKSLVACPIKADAKSAFVCMIQDEENRPDIFLHLSNSSEWHRPQRWVSLMDSNFSFLESVGLENPKCRICLFNTDIFSMFKSSPCLPSSPFVELIGSLLCADSVGIGTVVLPVAEHARLEPLAMVTNLFAVVGIQLSLLPINEAEVKKGEYLLQSSSFLSPK